MTSAYSSVLFWITSVKGGIADDEHSVSGRPLLTLAVQKHDRRSKA